MNTSLKEIAEIFSFVVREVDRVNSTIKQHPDLLQEILRKGAELQKQKNGWNAGGYICSSEAILRLFDIAKQKMNSYPELNGRCRVESFFRPLEDQIARRLIENREGINKWIETGETFLQEAKDYYMKYPWVAIVEVRKMEPEMGNQQALNILEQTLNCLRLVISSDSNHFIGIVEESPFSEISSSLAIDETGK